MEAKEPKALKTGASEAVPVQVPQTPRSSGSVPDRPMTPSQTLALAIQKGVDPSVLKQMLDLQERWEANEARKAYVAAMAAFKQKAPAVLAKDAEVDFTTGKGRTHYRHATLGAIVQQITAMLSEHGLGVSWSVDQANGGVSVTCHVTHERGHSESVTLTAPPDDSGNKNRIQQIGSTVTYLERYTLLAALGLATADQDDDGIAAGRRPGVDPAPRTSDGPADAGSDVPPCPRCGGPMWDNRAEREQDKRNIAAGKRKKPPRAAFRCKDKACDGAIWSASEAAGETPREKGGGAVPQARDGEEPPPPAAATPAEERHADIENERARTCVCVFEDMGVPRDTLEAKMCRVAGAWTDDDLARLGEVYKAIRDGKTTVEAEFGVQQPF